MKKLKVLIIEDNQEVANSIIESFLQFGDIEVVGVASNGKMGINLLEGLTPDVAIVNLVLPEIDGFAVLEYSKTLQHKCSIVLLSTFTNDQIAKKAFESGAKYFMVKPINYADLHSRIIAFADDTVPLARPIERKVVNQTRSLDEKISFIFLKIGIPAHIKGYQFLREGIKLCIENPDYINSITKGLYPKIANRFDTSASKVERAIRHAIEVAFNRGKIENMNSLFGVKVYGVHDKPTNSEFIALIADKLLIEGA